MIEAKPLSLYWEIRAFFYAGCLSLIWGTGVVVQKYAVNFGVVAMIAALTLAFLLCLAYCFRKAAPYSAGEVPSPTMAFDYVLYVGCALLSIDLGLFEANYHLFPTQWDIYVLGSSLLFLALAHRFDNRLVLSLALTGLAGWLGLKLNHWGLMRDARELAPLALGFGAVTGAAGLALHRIGIKKHFLNVYLNFGATFVFLALLTGSFVSGVKNLYFAGLLLFCAAVGAAAVIKRRFLYLTYAIVYGYIGVSAKILPHVHDTTLILMYLVFSSVAVISVIFLLAREFRDPA